MGYAGDRKSHTSNLLTYPLFLTYYATCNIINKNSQFIKLAIQSLSITFILIMITNSYKSLDVIEDPQVIATSSKVTPELAVYWLENQATNRKINDTYVNRLAEDMREGRWVFPGDPLKFNNQGKLIDGQHRLSAVVKLGIPQQFVILNGYKEESIKVLDLGKARSADHVGQILGMATTSNHTACINALNLPHSHLTYSIPKILNLWNIYGDGIKFACQSHGGCAKNGIQPTSSFRALIAKAYYYENIELLSSFFRCFTSGFAENGESDYAAIALNANYSKLRMKGVSLGSYNEKTEWYLKTQQALNYFIRRSSVRSINKPKKIVDHYPLPLISEDSEENLKRFKALNKFYQDNPNTPKYN